MNHNFLLPIGVNFRPGPYSALPTNFPFVR